MKSGERIFTLLKENNITAAKLSRDIGLSAGITSQWKKGLQKPSTEAITKIAMYFNVSTDYLLGNTDTPTHIIPEALNGVQAAFGGGAGEGLNEDDIDMLLDMAERLRKKNRKENKK